MGMTRKAEWFEVTQEVMSEGDFAQFAYLDSRGESHAYSGVLWRGPLGGLYVGPVCVEDTPDTFIIARRKRQKLPTKVGSVIEASYRARDVLAVQVARMILTDSEAIGGPWVIASSRASAQRHVRNEDIIEVIEVIAS